MKGYKLRLFTRNIYFVLAARLLLAMWLFTLCRVLFYLLNTGLFPQMTFGHFMYLLYGGLRFDLTAMLYTNVLFIAIYIVPFRFRYAHSYQRAASWVFYSTNGLALAANCIDFIYFRFTMRRTTFSVFREFANDAGNGSLLGRFFLDYWYVVLIFAALITLMVALYRRFKVEPSLIRSPWLYYPLSTLVMALCVGLLVAGVRGGFTRTTRPISINNAAAYVNNPAEIGIVLNTPFSIYRTLERKTYKRLAFYDSEEQLSAVYTPLHKSSDTTAFTPKNIVVIIVESLGREYIGALNKQRNIPDYVSYTPFLDSLIVHSLTFDRSFANGHKSIDAMPSVLASMPSFTDPYVLSVYANNRIEGLGTLLARKGYDCSFFHGAPNGSMGFDAFAQLSGFTHYYGKGEYGNGSDFDGFWGISDEPFLQFMAQTLAQKQEPFCAAVFTLSSHHPFKVPVSYEGKFPKGTLEIHQCIGYTDNALRRFFATASTMPWYANTLFVITADHTNQSYYERYKTSVGSFEVPVILYAPGDKALQGMRVQPTVQQVDILPTVLSYIHFNEPYFSFGKNMLDSISKNNFSINYNNGIYQILQDGYVLQTNKTGPVALYRYEADPLLQQDLRSLQPERVGAMDSLFRAFLQQYNNRLIDNQTTFSR